MLKDAPQNMWEYQQEGYNKLTKEDVKFSEMAEVERRFVHGLIRYTKPQRILEIGVAEGGGTIVLLNAIEDMPDTTVTSLDIATDFYFDKTKKTGFSCMDKHGDHKQWNLKTGKDPAEVIESLASEEKFDFVVLDTMHIHPIESLNFLSILPFLSENCVLVLHDIGLYAMNRGDVSEGDSIFRYFPKEPFATKLLFDTLVGDKIKIPPQEYGDIIYPNIGACQLNSDTRKYIGNVFSMLEFPWGYYPDKLCFIRDLVEKHYDVSFVKDLDRVAEKNSVLILNYNKSYEKTFLLETSPVHYQAKKMIFYGCGDYIRFYLINQKLAFSHPVMEIWDMNAEKVDTSIFRNDITVKAPDFQCSDKDNVMVVITLDPKKGQVESVKSTLLSHGFKNVIHFLELDSAT